MNFLWFKVNWKNISEKGVCVEITDGETTHTERGVLRGISFYGLEFNGKDTKTIPFAHIVKYIGRERGRMQGISQVFTADRRKQLIYNDDFIKTVASIYNTLQSLAENASKSESSRS